MLAEFLQASILLVAGGNQYKFKRQIQTLFTSNMKLVTRFFIYLFLYLEN